MHLSDTDLTLKNICRKKERNEGRLSNRHLGQNLQVGLRTQSYRTYRAAEANSNPFLDFSLLSYFLSKIAFSLFFRASLPATYSSEVNLEASCVLNGEVNVPG